MRLSIILPTYRSGPAAVARVAQACSWAGPNIEVIVRDNSGNPQKREQISRFATGHCNVVIADRCEPFDNFLKTFELAKGEFVFFVADDDLCFDQTPLAVLRALERFGGDPSVAGVTGHYAIESSTGTGMFRYADSIFDDVTKRVSGFLNNWGPNVLIYAALRREMVQRVMSFMRSMPVYLSFHDQILSLLYLLCGRFIELPRLLYSYDLGIWEFPESAQKRDIEFYTASGLDPATNRLQWFLCGFEGAMLIRNSAGIFPDYPLGQRQRMADQWFSTMFGVFQRQERTCGGSMFAQDAERLHAKLLKFAGQISFQSMLVEICEFVALSSAEKAQQYHDFWQAQMNAPATGGNRFESRSKAATP